MPEYIFPAGMYKYLYISKPSCFKALRPETLPVRIKNYAVYNSPLVPRIS